MVTDLLLLTQLRWLTLRSESVDDGFLARMVQLKQLSTLSIAGPFTRTGLSKITGMSLSRLTLNSRRLGEDDLATIARITRLRRP